MKKVLIFMLIFLLPVVSASLQIEKKAVIDTVIPEINQPAKYTLTLTNLGEDDVFEIYSLVGIDIEPNETFFVKSQDSKKLDIKLWPGQTAIKNPGTFNFLYKIKGKKSGIQEDALSIRILSLEDAFDINSYSISLDSDKAIVYAKNRIALEFPEIKARFSSAFFDFDRTFSLKGYEKKEFEIILNTEEAKRLVAGDYSMTAEIETFGVSKKIQNNFRFTEKAGISTKESKSGAVIRMETIEKKNEGNLPFVVQVKMKKTILSRLFTTFNTEPASAERDGIMVYYIFQKEIKPAESFIVRATTNWLYPLVFVVFLAVIVYLIRLYTSTALSLTKKAVFVSTKGGEFALKIILNVKARKFVEKINIVDRIPALVKIYERFGLIEPDKIDEKHKRLEWNIDSLQAGEERVFSYVVYSKIAPVGKFELPVATAIYEKDGKIHETESNKVFFLTETRKRAE